MRFSKYNDYLTYSEVSILLESKSPGQAAQKHTQEPKADKKINRLINQLGYEYSFVFIFAPAVKGLYPMISHLIQTMEIPQDISKESIVYLTISVLGILLNEPKSKYKELLKKVKDEGMYKLIKPLVTSLKGIKKIFTFIAGRIGKVITSFAEMFAYTALFVPFAMSFKDIIDQNTTTIMSVLEAFANQPIGKLLVTGVGIGGFAIKHFMEDIISKLKSFKDKGVEAVKRVINKIKSIDLSSIFPKRQREELPQLQTQDIDYSYGDRSGNISYIDRMFNENKILKFSDFK